MNFPFQVGVTSPKTMKLLSSGGKRSAQKVKHSLENKWSWSFSLLQCKIEPVSSISKQNKSLCILILCCMFCMNLTAIFLFG